MTLKFPLALIALTVFLAQAPAMADVRCTVKIENPQDRDSVLAGITDLGWEPKVSKRLYGISLVKEGKVVGQETFKTTLVDGMISSVKRTQKKWTRDCRKAKSDLVKKADKKDCDNVTIEEIKHINCEPRLHF